MRAVEAELNYLGPMSERPVFHPGVPGKTNLVLEPRTVSIVDARGLERPASLEAEGFALVEHATEVRDLTDHALLEGRYLDEVAELIRRVSGASEVRASPGPVARYADRSNEAKSQGTAPAARFVHTDYTDVSAREHFLPQVMDPQEARRYRRITIYQTWRALSGAPQDVPLTVADGRSVRLEDMVTADTILGDEYGGRGQSFEYSMCRHNPGHRWYYFSNMRPDEVLVFKGYDFDPGRPARLFHTAFDDPSAPADAPPRASIEARAFAFFED